MIRPLLIVLSFLLVGACSGADSGEPDVPALDFTVSDVDRDGGAEVGPDSGEADPGRVEVAPDVAPTDATPDLPANQPPGFDALDPLNVKMGHVVTLDVNAAIDDAEDADDALVLSWSSAHVALADDGSHGNDGDGPTFLRLRGRTYDFEPSSSSTAR